MGKCEYSFYESGDRCRIKAGVPGESSDRVAQDTYRNCCTYTDGHKKCPFFLAFQKNSNQSGGCYLTSACVQARGLADDCTELQTLRAFRDGWLMDQPYGSEIIHEYYHIAPAIVASIDQKPNAAAIYDAIYTQVVLPCVAFIQKQKNEDAVKIYSDTVRALKNYFVEDQNDI